MVWSGREGGWFGCCFDEACDEPRFGLWGMPLKLNLSSFFIISTSNLFFKMGTGKLHDE